MIDITNIKKFTIPRPDPNFIGTGKQFDELPETHQEQILFLDKPAEKYIFEFASAANLITGGFWAPFEKGNFKTIEAFNEFYGVQASKQILKKWLFNRGIPFPTWVFVLTNYRSPMLMTWKMMVKYAEDIFFSDDVMVFDSTISWCLVYFHENQMFFGKDRFYDPSENEQVMQDLNERKKKYPQFKHPFL